MPEQEDINRVVDALKKVPERHLLIIELANSVPRVNGILDVSVLQEMQGKVNLATAEAKAYGSHTLQAVDALVRVKAKGEV